MLSLQDWWESLKNTSIAFSKFEFFYQASIDFWLSFWKDHDCFAVECHPTTWPTEATRSATMGHWDRSPPKILSWSVRWFGRRITGIFWFLDDRHVPLHKKYVRCVSTSYEGTAFSKTIWRALVVGSKILLFGNPKSSRTTRKRPVLSPPCLEPKEERLLCINRVPSERWFSWQQNSLFVLLESFGGVMPSCEQADMEQTEKTQGWTDL